MFCLLISQVMLYVSEDPNKLPPSTLVGKTVWYVAHCRLTKTFKFWQSKNHCSGQRYPCHKGMRTGWHNRKMLLTVQVGISWGTKARGRFLLWALIFSFFSSSSPHSFSLYNNTYLVCNIVQRMLWSVNLECWSLSTPMWLLWTWITLYSIISSLLIGSN